MDGWVDGKGFGLGWMDGWVNQMWFSGPNIREKGLQVEECGFGEEHLKC